MKAVIVTKYGPSEHLSVAEVPKPTLLPKDLLVKLKAISVNPIDTKLRAGGNNPPREHLIFGFDGAGIVEAVGSDSKLFKVGDEVYFAGDISRNGTNAEYVAVDERIVGRKPKNFSWEQAAAVPLCGLTAWEGIEEQLQIAPNTDNSSKTILIVAGAGGVGSIAIPLAKKIFKLKVIATASRPETLEYVKKIGADHVIDHTKDMKEQLQKLGYPSGVDYIYNCADVGQNFDQIVPLIAPYGKILNITYADKLNVGPLFYKRATLTWEFMFARSSNGIHVEKQHEILNNLADLIEKGLIPDRVTKVLSLKKDLVAAHKQLESGTTVGKVVLTVDL